MRTKLAASYFLFLFNGDCKALALKTYIFTYWYDCDQVGKFLNISKIVGVTLECPYFLVSNEWIYFMDDSPHLPISTWNCPFWNIIKFIKILGICYPFHKVDFNTNKCAPKLSWDYIYPNNFQRKRNYY